MQVDAFLLSREWRDGPRGVDITLWATSTEHGPIKVVVRDQEPLFFVPRDAIDIAARREPIALTTPFGAPVDAAYFRAQRDLTRERDRLRDEGVETFEADLKPSERFLMERFITSAVRITGEARSRAGVLTFLDPEVRAADVTPRLRVLALDIETDGYDGPLLSIALATREREHVLVRGEGRPRGAITFHPDERALLDAAFALVREIDPDVLAGWNVVEFDLRVLQARAAAYDLAFSIGRAGERARILEGDRGQVSIARVPGRVVLDGIATLKNATYSFERFTLDLVAKELVGRGKAIGPGVDPIAEIRRMHAEDPDALARYNLEDCRLVLDVFDAADLVGFAIERARLTGLPLDRQGGSVAAFDHVYLPRLHRRGAVAPNVGHEAGALTAPGGHVLESAPGLYRNVLSFDFRSLYPSIIRTFGIDPLGLWRPGDDPIPGFDGACFARKDAILPGIVAHLAQARAAAKNEALSRAIKILMNSFYGVLGTPGCRFFDPRLASSITRRGHEIIERSRAFFEDRGLRVIYGDTDSLFVRADETLDEGTCRAEGARLAAEVTAFWREALARELGIESVLELRFESHYLCFLMPTMRGSERGSKKRYAGQVRKKSGELSVVIRGLEAIRSDWTPLAKHAQRELLRRVFEDEPWQEWLRAVRADVLAGRRDGELVYRKRLRRDVAEYESEPPHVRAARLREGGEASKGEIEYVVTGSGPAPASERRSRIDHRHYVDKQLAPACDVVLHVLGTSFEDACGAQLSLFPA
ncbi:MAG: DNA polymerase II [Sandaracinaceae bacterium]|nr:DNA polymerase II [Sandaracinaceae bacterium]